MVKLVDKNALPRVDFLKKDARLEALANKMVMPATGNIKRNNIEIPNIFEYGAISKTLGQSVNDADAMFQLLPDLDLTEQILISSILAPKDYVHSELSFKSSNDGMDAEVTASLLKVVEDYFTKVYKIKNQLPDMLSDALFRKGSYPIAVLPENAIDAVINSPRRASLEDVSTEFNKEGRALPLGILGVPPRVDGKVASKRAMSLEDLAGPLKPPRRQYREEEWRVNDFTSVTDNFSMLKMPALRDKLTQDRLQDIFALRKVSLEARRSDSETNVDRNLEMSMYRRRQYNTNQVVQIQSSSAYTEDTVGHPLVMHLPHEAVITIHRPSSPKEHVAYFILIDQYGNPVTKEDSRDYFNQMGNSLNGDESAVSSLLRNTMNATTGITGMANWGHDKIVDPTSTYASIVEADLKNRIRAGIYGETVEISRPTDVYRIMLARALAKQQTQLLCIPAELMTYIAFDHNEDGTGRSLVESSKILGSIRAMLLFADTMAAINNSTPKTRLNIQLDPLDPDASGTVSFLLAEHAKTKRISYPIGASNPMDIINYLQEAGVIINVTGNTGYPETKVDTEDYQSNRARPDTALQEEMRKRHNQHFGLTPETVDLSMQADFATSVVTSNILFAKRVLIYQTTFCGFLQEHIKQYTLNSGTLMTELRKIVETNKSKLGKSDRVPSIDVYLLNFVNSIEVALPTPDTTALESQLKALETYKQGIDTALAAYIDAGFLDASVIGDSANSLEMIIASIKAYYIRRYLREENILPELADLVTFDEKNGPALNLLEVHTAHVDAIRKTFEGFIEHFAKAVAPKDDGMDSGAIDDGSVSNAGTGSDIPADISDEFSDTDVGAIPGDDTATPPDDGTGEPPEATPETSTAKPAKPDANTPPDEATPPKTPEEDTTPKKPDDTETA